MTYSIYQTIFPGHFAILVTKTHLTFTPTIHQWWFSTHLLLWCQVLDICDNWPHSTYWTTTQISHSPDCQIYNNVLILGVYVCIVYLSKSHTLDSGTMVHRYWILSNKVAWSNNNSYWHWPSNYLNDGISESDHEWKSAMSIKSLYKTDIQNYLQWIYMK